jgi:hypothetical protein
MKNNAWLFMNQLNRKGITFYSLLLSATLLLSETPAYSKNDNSPKSHTHKIKHKELKTNNNNIIKKVIDNPTFNDESRNVILSYLQNYQTNNKTCPPGLAKKNPLCMPPGQYKKYVVGKTLPEDIIWNSLPADLLQLLPTSPKNTFYGIVDNDVLLISAETKLVLDAISLLSR